MELKDQKRLNETSYAKQGQTYSTIRGAKPPLKATLTADKDPRIPRNRKKLFTGQSVYNIIKI
jgi:hypothetical protein